MKKRIIALLLCICTLTVLFGCAVPEEHRFVNPTEWVEWEPTDPPAVKPTDPAPAETTPPHLTAKDMAKRLSDRDLVAQLFLVKCPADGAAKLLRDHHVGGIILYSSDVSGHTPATLSAELSDWQERSPIPLIVAVDEEGGDVVRLSNNKNFRSERFPAPSEVYYEGGLDALRDIEAEKAELLKSCGINVNLSPVCDVVSEETGFMASRSLFQTAKTTGKAVSTMVKTMQGRGIGAVLKHFPGYGNLTGDTHTGKVVDDRDKEFLQAYDFVPFEYGIRAGAGAVMVGHSIVNKLDPTAPASLSGEVHRVLRKELGFQGVIITDDLTMGAVTDTYESGEAAVQALHAGNDLLITAWSEHQFNAIYEALTDGRLSRKTLENCAERIIQWKMDLGLL